MEHDAKQDIDYHLCILHYNTKAYMNLMPSHRVFLRLAR